MVSTTIKAVLISTGVTVLALFLKATVPIALDFSLSRFLMLWSSFLSWLKPPYLFAAINVIITIIVATSSYHDDGEDDDESLHVHRAPLRQLEVKHVNLDADILATFSPPILVREVEREVVYEEKEEEEISGLINSGDEFVVLTSKLSQVPSMIGETENLSPAKKPLVSTRSDGHRIPVKASPKGGKKRKALRMAKPKITLENTWKILAEEEMSTPLTSPYQRSSDTIGLGAGEAQPALRKSVTFRDMTNYQKSPTVTPPVKMKKEMSPSREELNRRVEAFIKKCKDERLESVRFDKDLVKKRDLS